MNNLYAVLGVEWQSDMPAIRAAYRSLARRDHPDHGGDEHAMARLNEAWHVLGKPERRAAYDAELQAEAAALAQPTATPRETRDGHTVLDFGRYAGRSVSDVAAMDDDYLVWLARTPIGRPLRTEIDGVLGRRAEAIAASQPRHDPRRRPGRPSRR